MNKFILFLISMTPFIELRGAIPYGLFLKIDPYSTIIISIIGNILPIPFIFFFSKRILYFGLNKKYIGKICKIALRKGYKLGIKLENKANLALYISLLLFVGIPIPGTGIWTATIAASLLNLRFRKVFISISLGVLMAATIVSLLSLGIIKIGSL